jgi:hypothetical protein
MRSLLHASHKYKKAIDDVILSQMAMTNHFAMRTWAITTSDEAVMMYEQAWRVPQQETRQAIFNRSKVTIDDFIVYPGLQRTVFFSAFKKNRPMVLKIPVMRDGQKGV